MGRLFGTDGVRGVANSELTCELAMNIGRAAATVLTDSSHRHPKILIGKDTRLSSDMLEAAITAGLCSVGANVVRLGVVPTPAVAFLVGKYKADAGVMLTASHNPCEFNGIKIFSGDGYKLPDALEEQIEAIVLDHAQEPACPVGGAVGSVSEAPNTVRDYVDHIKSTVPFALTGMKIAVDCANGSASRTAELLFSELGAECHMLSDHPNGINVNDACGSTHMENLMRFVGENDMDAGVAFDGDADRCLAVDENGRLVDGDFLMAICAADLKSRGKLEKNTVVGTIMTNMGFNRFCEDDGIKFESTKVGDRYVLEEMLLEGYNFGGEQSGHIIFHDFATTGDGQLTAAQLLSILKRREAKLSSLATLMTRYPQVLVNVDVKPDGKLRFYTDPQVKEAVDGAKKQLGNRGRVVVRPSGTEPLLRVMVEGEDETEIAEAANVVAGVIRDRLA
ncbi:Phosphoglucosamine mutase [Caprobacter fermentans]|uniref:Phosphoglucosamine mutase n=1 Tax=Caproicibacter fermentans TaxID=2576756 RepID=A0A6N8HX32_9FIRM|nr:phosphoglucosamine mutase [Caproicibacter fermentans]MVB10366.1 Phosphoglucosamine mutase [Caproicibacter fermentans]OCN01278.1 phosphoglucosamine mutase [Clostridium sp. W14A]QNK40410.1 phosphoglucosamine mutase [Caproicibacter fermentans]